MPRVISFLGSLPERYIVSNEAYEKCRRICILDDLANDGNFSDVSPAEPSFLSLPIRALKTPAGIRKHRSLVATVNRVSQVLPNATIGEMISLTKNDFLALRGIGPRTLSIISAVLEDYCLHFADES
jgi:hypothetical protein